MSQPPMGVSGGRFAPPMLRQKWQTVNPAHAIQRTAAIVSFPEELPTFVVNRVVEVLRPVAKAAGLVKEEVVNAMLIQIGPGGAQHTTSSNQTGCVFQNVQGNQIVQALNVTKEAIRFETTSYTRWLAFREQLQSFFDAALPLLKQSTTFQSIALEYVDFFFAAAEGAEDVGLVIDHQSQFIAKRAFRKREPFHSNSGWFERETEQSRYLVNVDLSVADAMGPVGQRRAITIRTFEAEHVADMNNQRAVELVELQNLLSGLDDLHASLKARLRGLLTRDAQAMITLGS